MRAVSLTGFGFAAAPHPNPLPVKNGERGFVRRAWRSLAPSLPDRGVVNDGRLRGWCCRDLSAQDA